jgi:hypothetical protein
MAPYAYRVTRVTISGTTFNGAEEWSTGFFMGNVAADADLPNQQLADDIRAAWATFFTTASTGVGASWESTLVKVSSFGTDGKSDANDTVFSTFPAVTKGAGVNLWPPQISLVATLTGAQARGLAMKGRMYLPGIQITPQATGKIASASVLSIANNLKTFLTAVNASTATTNVVINASHGQLFKDATGKYVPKVGGRGPVNAAVTGIKIGDVYDTQRRRRNGLTETYQTVAGPF